MGRQNTCDLKVGGAILGKKGLRVIGGGEELGEGSEGQHKLKKPPTLKVIKKKNKSRKKPTKELGKDCTLEYAQSTVS